jgi:hypothetical protein
MTMHRSVQSLTLLWVVGLLLVGCVGAPPSHATSIGPPSTVTPSVAAGTTPLPTTVPGAASFQVVYCSRRLRTLPLRNRHDQCWPTCWRP